MRISAFILLLSSLLLVASEPALLRLPPSNIPPRIDGKETPGEWDGASGSFGTLRIGSGFLSQRNTHFKIAYDQDYLYFRCQSELPPSSMNLVARVHEDQGKVFLDDAVELLLLPPGGKYVYQLLMNFNARSLGIKYPISYGSVSHEIHQEWQPAVEIACGRLADAWWLLELRMPIKDLGLTAVPWDQQWGLQMIRDWQQPAEQSPWNRSSMFCDPAQMGVLIMDQNAPVLNFRGPGQDYLAGKIDLLCDLFNPTGHPLALKGSMILESDAAPRQAESEWLLAPAGKELFQLRFEDTPHTSRHLKLKIIDRDRNITLLQRQFSWEPPTEAVWVNPEQNRMQELDFAFYPYQKFLKAKLQNATETVFTLKNSAGTPWGSSLTSNDGQAEWRELELPSDTYTIEATAEGRTHQRQFQVSNFPWEHNQIGLDDSIIPPFRPLQLEQRKISALLTAYKVRNGFWDAIDADGENILAAPIELKIDGNPLQETSFAVHRLTPHNIQCTSVLGLPGLEVESHQDYDYDGMCKVSLRFRPKNPLDLQKVWIEIPLRNEFVSLMHSVGNVMKKNPALVLPEGEGLLWHSLMASEGRLGKINYRPYIWLGGIYRGLSWFAQSDRYLSLSAEIPAMEIRREKDHLILRIFLVNIPTRWEKPFELVMGFQATPVKPQPESWRRLSARRQAPNSIPFATLAGPAIWGSDFHYTAPYPAGHDYSMIQQLAKDKRRNAWQNQQDINEFVQKHFSGAGEEKQNFVRRHLERGRSWGKFCDYLIPYLNSRTLHKDWDSYPVYQDEWWCSDYRANSYDEYNNTPVRSYQDMMVFYARQLVQQGLDGIYYDNVRDWPVSDTSTGPAWKQSDGSIQPYFDIFDMRALIKRTAVMLWQENKTLLDGRPFLIAHMTNTNLVPFMSFTSMTLDLEAFYGSTDFQERFSDGWLLNSTIGTQTGNIPQILVQNSGTHIEWLTRTFLAVTMPYDLPVVMVAGGITNTFHKSWDMLRNFGYGTADVESFPCWNSPPVKTANKDVRIAVHRHRKRQESILCIGSKTKTDLTVELSLAGLNYQTNQITDLENGKELPCNGTNLQLSLPGYDFRILLVREK
ncbi:MAG: DUF6067 family protein [Lentisphaeria bacterium]|nr:DUF6067 family protein [Lentisphaeria bacterium]